MSETVDLRVQETVQSVRLGSAQLMRGYVYRCKPTSGEPIELEDEEGQMSSFGFHGTDVPPCAAEYLADGDGESTDAPGYLVISSCENADEIVVVEGWNLVPAVDLEPGSSVYDGTWRLCILASHAHQSHEYTVAGYSH